MSMDEVTFTRGPARRPIPRVSDPLLQWATGLQTKERRIYAGWLAEAGKIDALDAAMEQAGFAQVTIKHGSGNMVTHWAVETANLFVIAEGVQSIGEMKHTTERYGIAFGWRTLPGGRQQSQLRFQKLARRDGLTGILNRQHFMDEAKMAVAYCARSSREACLILIDLDHFKDVNDSHGHVTGYGVLKRTVAICQLYMRSMDTYGRLGGEEFGVLLPDCALDVAAQRAEELRHAISSFVVGEKDRDSDVNVTASFGVTSTRYSGYDLRQMLIHADSALYRAKREGRNRVESHAAKSADAAPGANHGPAVIVLDGKV